MPQLSIVAGTLGSSQVGTARYYDPYINRFIQADTIVPAPGSSQAYNRYMYGYGNPMANIDPDGHDPVKPPDNERDSRLPDVYGFRIEGSTAPFAHLGDLATLATSETIVGAAAIFFATHTGIDANLDFVHNVNTSKNNIIFTGSLQTIQDGSGISAGPLFMWNVESNEELTGFQMEMQAGLKAPVGDEGGLGIGFPANPSGDLPHSLYIGVGGGDYEVTAGLSIGVSINITDMVMEKATQLANLYVQTSGRLNPQLKRGRDRDEMREDLLEISGE